MENLKINLSRALALLTLLSLLAIGCGDSSTDSEEPPEEEPTDGSFNSGTISPDGTFTYTFENEGSFEYFCQFHEPDMQGKVIVSPDAESAQSDTVLMQNEQFVPAQITVAPNTEVVWINMDNVNHTVTSGNPDQDEGDPRY